METKISLWGRKSLHGILPVFGEDFEISEIGEMLILTNSLGFLPLLGRRPGWQQVSELGELGGSGWRWSWYFNPSQGRFPDFGCLTPMSLQPGKLDVPQA